MLADVCLGGMGNSAKVALYCYVYCVLVGTSLYEIFTGTLLTRSVAPGLAEDPYRSLILCWVKHCGSVVVAVVVMVVVAAVCGVQCGSVCGVNTESVLKQ
jgi:hypothetical protein